MKTWEEYKDFLMKGNWHIHTSYTDGKNTVFDYCREAIKRNVPLLAFTEHVRKEVRYNFDKLLEDIDKAREEFPDLIILSGCEAKVLPDGTLDVNKKLIKKVDYPIMAYHSFPKDKELYLKTLKKTIKNPFVNSWAHPGLFLNKTGFELKDEELGEIFELMKKHRVLLEINKKYELPPEQWIKQAKRKGVLLVRGNDTHSVNEL